MVNDKTTTETKLANDWIEKFITPEQLNQVAQSIQEVEKHTSGEVVVMIVRRSSMIRHVPYVLFLFLAFLTLFVDRHFSLLSTAILVFVWAPLSFWLAKFKWVQRLFTHSADREFQVAERSEIEFNRHQLAQTKARTAVLIFISLMERQAVVLADKAIAAKFPADSWQEVVAAVIDGIKKRQVTQGLLQAVSLCGQRLKPHFPPEAINSNEIANHVIVKE